jgi:Ca2+-binding EF-hand superfamily protein
MFISGNGTIEFDEFVKMMASKTSTSNSGVNRETFDVFDVEKTGYITAKGIILFIISALTLLNL